MSYLALIHELSRDAYIVTNGAAKASEAYKTTEEQKRASRFASRHAAECAAHTYIHVQAPAVRRYMSYEVKEAPKRQRREADDEYAARARTLEEEGMSTSDAQACADVEVAVDTCPSCNPLEGAYSPSDLTIYCCRSCGARSRE